MGKCDGFCHSAIGFSENVEVAETSYITSFIVLPSGTAVQVSGEK